MTSIIPAPFTAPPPPKLNATKPSLSVWAKGGTGLQARRAGGAVAWTPAGTPGRAGRGWAGSGGAGRELRGAPRPGGRSAPRHPGGRQQLTALAAPAPQARQVVGDPAAYAQDRPALAVYNDWNSERGLLYAGADKARTQRGCTCRLGAWGLPVRSDCNGERGPLRAGADAARAVPPGGRHGMQARRHTAPPARPREHQPGRWHDADADVPCLWALTAPASSSPCSA